MNRKASVKARNEMLKNSLAAQNNRHRHTGTWRKGKNNGSEGLETARAKKRKKNMKELARSAEAYTVKVPLPYCGMDDPAIVVGYINDQACRLRFARHEDKRGKGLMVRAEVTDAKEVWARVVPDKLREKM